MKTIYWKYLSGDIIWRKKPRVYFEGWSPSGDGWSRIFEVGTTIKMMDKNKTIERVTEAKLKELYPKAFK